MIQVTDEEKQPQAADFSNLKDELESAYREQDTKTVRRVFSEVMDMISDDTINFSERLGIASNILYFTMYNVDNGEKVLRHIFERDAMGYNSLYEAKDSMHIMIWMFRFQNGICELINEEKKASEKTMVPKVQRYIQNHIKDKITLAETARVFGVSSAYLSTLFSKHSELGFNEFVNWSKVEEAKKMLRQHVYKISEISERLGYKNPFYFSRVFKKFEGISPMAYEHKVRQQGEMFG